MSLGATDVDVGREGSAGGDELSDPAAGHRGQRRHHPADQVGAARPDRGAL